MLKKVLITQTQDAEEINTYVFEGEVVSYSDELIKVIYLRDLNKKANMIIKKLSNCELEFGTLGEMNKLKMNELSSYKQNIAGYDISLFCRLNSFIFEKDYIEINYSFFNENQKISDNVLKIANKN